VACVKVKLADILMKTILPVSFLKHWPPKCLAIQFATTQYIPCQHDFDHKHGTQLSSRGYVEVVLSHKLTILMDIF